MKVYPEYKVCFLMVMGNNYIGSRRHIVTIVTDVMVLVLLTGIGLGYGRFGDGVFVHEIKAAENAGDNMLRSLCLDGVEFLVHICLHELVKGLGDLGGVVYTVFLVLNELPKNAYYCLYMRKA